MKKKISTLIAKVKLRISRGKSWFYEIQTIIYLIVGLKIFEVPWIWYIPAGIIILLAWYFIGLYDEKRAKVWQSEASYSSKELNPFIRKLGKIEKEIINMRKKIK